MTVKTELLCPWIHFGPYRVMILPPLHTRTTYRYRVAWPLKIARLTMGIFGYGGIIWVWASASALTAPIYDTLPEVRQEIRAWPHSPSHHAILLSPVGSVHAFTFIRVLSLSMWKCVFVDFSSNHVLLLLGFPVFKIPAWSIIHSLFSVSTRPIFDFK